MLGFSTRLLSLHIFLTVSYSSASSLFFKQILCLHLRETEKEKRAYGMEVEPQDPTSFFRLFCTRTKKALTVILIYASMPYRRFVTSKKKKIHAWG